MTYVSIFALTHISAIKGEFCNSEWSYAISRARVTRMGNKFAIMNMQYLSYMIIGVLLNSWNLKNWKICIVNQNRSLVLSPPFIHVKFTSWLAVGNGEGNRTFTRKPPPNPESLPTFSRVTDSDNTFDHVGCLLGFLLIPLWPKLLSVE